MLKKRHEFQIGLRDGLPVSLGYFPYGIAYGLLAKQAGLDVFQTLSMSAFVYAGTSQFIAVALIAAGQTASAIAIAAVVVNLRYILMNSALAEAMKGWKIGMRLLISFFVSDETFVVLSKRFEEKKLTENYSLGVNTIANFGWILSSFIGFAAGQYFDLKKFGFDFALVAVLIALAVLMVKNKTSVVVGLMAAFFSIVLNLYGFKNLSVLVAALVASSIGVISTWKKTKSI